MAYPLDGDPVKYQMLEAIRTTVAAIATPTYHFDFQEVQVFDSGRILMGEAFPFCAIVPESDNRLRELSCAVVEREAVISLVAAVRCDPRDTVWKKDLHWLVSDIEVALRGNPQLSGTCIYHEVEDADAYEITDQSTALAAVSLRVVYRHLSDNPTLTTSA